MLFDDIRATRVLHPHSIDVKVFHYLSLRSPAACFFLVMTAFARPNFTSALRVAPSKAFIACLKEHNSDHLPCKTLSKHYLECRMERRDIGRWMLFQLSTYTYYT